MNNTAHVAPSDSSIKLRLIDRITEKHHHLNGNPKAEKAVFTIRELREASKNSSFDTQPRAYQREKVASTEWKQNLISTVFLNGIYQIPEIHVRSNDRGNGIILLEMIDGQQRWTSIEDYMDNKFPSNKGQPNVDGHEVANKLFRNLPDDIKAKFEDFDLYATVYYNITDDQTRELFVDILNNTNDINAQEKRNAMRGPLPKGIREISRDFNRTNPKMHKVFQYQPDAHDKNKLLHFNEKFTIGRMQTDEFSASLLYALTHLKKWTDGITSTGLTTWYKETVKGHYENEDSIRWVSDYKKLHEMLDDLYLILENVPKEYKKKKSRLVSLVMVLYYSELKKKFGKVDHKCFAESFFKVYTKWSSTKPGERAYEGREWERFSATAEYDELDKFLLSEDFIELDLKDRMILREFVPILSGFQSIHTIDDHGQKIQKPLGTFYNLFGGMNKNAFTTIRDILEYERRMGSNSEWGIIHRDNTRTFTDRQKDIVYDQQNGLDYYDGKPLDRGDAVADHIIPWSRGIVHGGTTSIDNCAVTSTVHNKTKGNMSGAEYKQLLAS